MHNILFSQVREDPRIEMIAIKKYLKKSDKLNGLVVCSGGCTLLSILSNNIDHIDVIDINPEQLYFVELKTQICIYLNDKDKIINFIEGNYEPIDILNIYFAVRNNMSENARNYWNKHIELLCKGINKIGKFETLFASLVESNFDFDKVFDRKVLVNIFGENAVANSLNRNFNDHFNEVFKIYKTKYTPENNYFYNQIINNKYTTDLPPYLNNIDNIIKNHHKMEYIADNILGYLMSSKSETYDFIQTSNISDWMNGKILSNLIKEIYRCLKPNGIVIMRRLNSDILLKDILQNKFEILDIGIIDKSHFYSEVIVAKVIKK